MNLSKTTLCVAVSLDEASVSRKLKNTQFLFGQGLVFRGNKNEINFDQLMYLRAKNDPKITLWMEKQRDKCLLKDIQNEVIRLMTFRILRNITEKINGSVFLYDLRNHRLY